ncbi:hypothetical protein AB1K89_17865 [Sporosarcina sp. 179-K 8C2 HS]|uniref:hypothetical protein n=1 Tax=Sporosarcina sp. 179-K 8C2 HS TaxID=3142387 RepID=UPI0039A09F0A
MDKIKVINLVPKFLAFYEKAQASDADARWDLWKEHYGFAAVPPGDEGLKMAREMLEAAWSQYADVIPTLETWRPDEKGIEEVLQKVKDVLGCEEDVSITFLYFVGAFDENPFVAPTGDGGLAVCLPVEKGLSDIVLAHELTHIVHAKTANLSMAWERTIGSTVFQEGLAMHVSKAVVPGHADEDYTEHKEGWLEATAAKKSEILEGILPYLEDSSAEAVMKFTFGSGETGLEREAYYAGWVLVELLLNDGVSFKEIAAIPEEEMPELARENMERLLVTS